jgi:S1-C subfamily serine protease
MKARLASAVTATAIVLTAGCSVLPQSPPALPTTYIPVVDVSPSMVRDFESADGFSRVERVSMRVRVITCGGFSNGSAWVLNENTVVTNRHVIEDAVTIELTSYDGRDYTGTSSVVADFADLALIKVDAEFTEFATIANDEPENGDELSIVGYPEGSRLHTETGKYGQVVEDTLGKDHDDVYSIGAPAKPGNSGSPVANDDDEVVGVLYAGTDGIISYVVALPSLKKFIEDESLHKPNKADC